MSQKTDLIKNSVIYPQMQTIQEHILGQKPSPMF